MRTAAYTAAPLPPAALPRPPFPPNSTRPMRRSASRVVPTPAPPLKTSLAAVFIVAHLAAMAAAIEPVYWRQRVFFIPYQPAANAPQIEKVQLLVARDGAGEWAVLQEAEPRVRGFSYHAPVDGEYSFAV